MNPPTINPNNQPANISRVPPPSLRVLQRASTIDESRLYKKHNASGLIHNGTSSGALGGATQKKLLKQASFANNPNEISSSYGNTRPASSPSIGGLSIMSGPRKLSTTIVDTDKLLAAKKRREDAEESANILPPPKIKWSTKFRIFLTICTSTLLILISTSLLFITILILDPILVGLKAQFRDSPGICKTIALHNFSGPSNCIQPTCREGCTVDLYLCKFIYVSYYDVPSLNFSFVQNYYNPIEIEDEIVEENGYQNVSSNFRLYTNKIEEFNFSSLITNDTNLLNTSNHEQITLMINPIGCGYPPLINCSEFYNRFSKIGFTYPCFFSDVGTASKNKKIAVPFYNRSKEIFYLQLFFGIPFVSILILGLFLIILVKISSASSTFFKFTNRTRIWKKNESGDFGGSNSWTSFSRRKVGDNTNNIRLKDMKLLNSSTSGDSLLRLEEIPEVLNGHGPKTKDSNKMEEELIQSNAKTDEKDHVKKNVLNAGENNGATIEDQVQFQRPSTSKNILPLTITHH